MMSTASKINMQMGIRSMFTEEFAQGSSSSSQFGDLFHPDQISCPSSSSSSLRSFSVGSPEYSSLMLSNSTTSTSSPRMPDASLIREWSSSIEAQVITTQQRRSAHDLVPPHQATMQAYDRIRHAQLPAAPTSDAVDAEVARAMVAVISSSSPAGQDQLPARRRPWGAFRPYDSPPLRPKIAESMRVSRGQRMMKRAFAILRQIKAPVVLVEESPRLGSNQWNHVMSERKRREKLNESFAALRESLPPGTKGDKASVLARTVDFVNSLRAEISELERKNRYMEARLLPPRPDETDVDDQDDASAGKGTTTTSRAPARITIEIGAPRPSTSSGSTWQQIELRVIARVPEYCDMIDLVLHILERLKWMKGGVKLVSLDASCVHADRQLSPLSRAILTVQMKVSDWDEDSFKGAIASAAEAATRTRGRPETETETEPAP